jgi:hypothetical protein
MTPLARDHHGPRALLNAVARLVGSYAAQCTRTRQDLTIVQHQLREYEARLDAAFPHERYVADLTELRDRLKAALANPAEQGAEMPALAERIHALTASQSIEAVPEHQTPRATATAAEPVTTRILQHMQETPTPEPDPQPLAPVMGTEPLPLPSPTASFPASQPALFAALLSRPGISKPARRQRISRQEPAPAEQLRLF